MPQSNPESNLFSDETNINSDFDELFKNRNVILKQVERFEAFLTDRQTKPVSVVEFKFRLEKFKACWDKFMNIQDAIEISSPDSASESNSRDNFEQRYFNALVIAEELSSSISGETKSASSGNQTNNDELDDLGIRIKPISLPSFDGKYEDWLSFSDVYKSAIHCNDKISTIRKFYCLRNCLTGVAANVIKNIETTEANYQGAWELIESRFSNKKLISQKHLKSLFDLPRVVIESAKDLRALLDNTLKHIQALKALQHPVESWDALIVHLITSKLDPSTFKAWQEFDTQNEFPTFDSLKQFMNQRCQILESLPQTSNTTKSIASEIKVKQNQVASSSKFNLKAPKSTMPNNSCLHTQFQTKCKLCSQPHKIFGCKEFLNLSVDARHKKVAELSLCPNCLKPKNHEINQCTSSKCKFCNQSHNSLLHKIHSKEPSSSLTEPSSQSVSATAGCSAGAILSTALVQIVNSNSELISCRVLLDSGSQSNFLTESMCQFLGLNCTKVNLPISGINGASTQIAHKVHTTIKSNTEEFSRSVDFLVIPQITSHIPSQRITCAKGELPNVPLADPTWNSPGRIDGLVGAQLFWDLLLENKINIPNRPYSLRETKLGWIVCGASKSDSSFSGLCHLSSLSDINEHIQSFWKLEELATDSVAHTGEDFECEEKFSKTVSRTQDGRYVVSLPLRKDPSVLGDSEQMARRRFFNLEAKLVKQPHLYDQYKRFMEEYIRLGHMKESTRLSRPSYFIPHHCVIKESSSTTKLRVVFDASAKTTSGISLNDIMMVGPCIQDTLFSILLRFRTFNYIFTADIEKMYRQTMIDHSQTSLQKIFWRNHPDEKLKIYELQTVTYGTASAPYLATRSLKQLFDDEGSDFQHSQRVLKDFYIDDLITGCNTVHEGLQIQSETIALLKRGHLHLRKWCATHPELLKNIPDDDKEPLQTFHFQDHSAAAVKTLGLIFDPNQDAFLFNVKDHVAAIISKRKIISEVALIFDPLGIVGPVIVMAKMFMQRLWREGLGWDEDVPQFIKEEWMIFRQTLSCLEKMSIPRQVTINPGSSLIELHAFSDASESAYGACIYIRSISTEDGSTLGVNLLCSKSRVAPLKATSLPRLELAAALLAAQLAEVVQKSLNIDKTYVHYWTDSTVVLAWICAQSTNWVTFVANRVAKIQDISEINQWHHISGIMNPADIISRGLQPDQLSQSDLWWHGPSFLMSLSDLASTWEFPEWNLSAEVPEKRNIKLTVHVSTNSDFAIIHKFSSFKFLLRVMAYVKRFIKNAKTHNPQNRQGNLLTVTELEEARVTVLQLTQREVYSEEIRQLKKQKPLPKSCKLSNLNPYLCERHLLRVGGRISSADVSDEQKHPTILPSKHHITELIAREKHLELLHCGPQTLLAALRHQYWPLNGRHLTRNTVRKCIRCFKTKPSFASQLMGNLPKARVNPSRPFTHTGLDYLGPVMVKLSNTRKPTVVKSYVALFICFATKAIHLELVEDQSTESFLSALRRFISRRGKPSVIYSDNSTTFKGAANQLKSWFQSAEFQNQLSSFSNDCGITWKFIPPYSPHMGGLWEANVKRVKHHLRRTMGSHLLTYVNLTTLLTEIEAIINSRPLFPESNDPSDLSFLSPAHFLVGGSLTAPPEPNLEHIPTNRLKQWQLVQQMTQSFWNKWKTEYLAELQLRTKWKDAQPSLTTGTLALIRDDHSPPLSWTVGRVVELHSGPDHKVRVVSLKTPSGIVRRSIARVCPLPLGEEFKSS